MPLRVVLLVACIPVASGPAGGVECLPGFADGIIVEGLSGATAMAVSPDGRLFICEQEGDLRIVKDGRLVPGPFLRVDVDSHWERGLIGIALDPGFPDGPRRSSSPGAAWGCSIRRRARRRSAPSAGSRVSGWLGVARGAGAVLPGLELLELP